MARSFCLILLAVMALLIGCELEEPISFEEVSAPYLEAYGPPEEINEYVSSAYHSIDWWWWTRGVMVCFVDSEYDDVDGWTVDSTYYFPPIY